ncbi:MAG: O-acetylhomoserine sulfhydrylase [Ignavibacteriae bacterium]|nr:MAG: O-acetylhomoserine sulfhydrylase [Ignavibacteriota bacterium]
METQLIYGKALSKKWDYNHHVIPPISSSATFRLDTAKRGAQGFMEFAHHTETQKIESCAPIYIYDRLGEPNKELLEENLAAAERGEIAVTFSTGMAAISAVLGCLTGIGDEIIAHSVLYGCTYSLLTNWYPRYNIKTKFINLTNPKNLLKEINQRTRIVYFETPVNPNLDLIDISEVAKILNQINKQRPKARKIYLIIDNTFATPYCQRPLELGADFVVESLTKGITGFGTDMGGVVVGPKWSYDLLLMYRKDFGGSLAAKSAWPIMVYGLPSLPIRFKQAMASALEVAKFLSTNPKIDYVRYPGLDSFPQLSLARRQMLDYEGNFAPGVLIYFSFKGKTPKIRKEKGEKFINILAKEAYTITLAVSLGMIRTLVEHPSSMTHAAIPPEEQIKKGIDPGGIRMSIGIEKTSDIIADLKYALSKI